MTATSYRYLLDTNIVSEIVRNPHGAVTRRIARVGEERVCTSIIVACELRYGAAKKASLRLGEQLEAVLAALPIVALERDSDRHYGEIRADLERRGKPIGPNDLLIAAQARSLGLVLVTDNVREFGRVRDLDVKNWLPQ